MMDLRAKVVSARCLHNLRPPQRRFFSNQAFLCLMERPRAVWTVYLVKYVFQEGEKSRSSASVEAPFLAERVVIVVKLQHDSVLLRQASGIHIPISPIFRYTTKPKVHRQQTEHKER